MICIYVCVLNCMDIYFKGQVKMWKHVGNISKKKTWPGKLRIGTKSCNGLDPQKGVLRSRENSLMEIDVFQGWQKRFPSTHTS